jgi:murein DD-endopeptidase MepM/ murein hydrolase activator NlpD
MDDLNSPLTVLPHNLFVSTLPNGEKEFFCFICFPNGIDQTKQFSWRITSNKDRSTFIGGERSITDKEGEQYRVAIAVILPAEFKGGELTVSLAPYQKTWQIQSYDQKGKFRLPLNGQVLVLIGHKIGETHRSAFQVPSQQFGWDLLPLYNDGLRLLKRPLSENLEAQDFEGFGQPILAPASGLVVKAVDGVADFARVGELPANLDYYLEDLTRALGNHVIIDHGEGVWSCLAHLKNGSVQVKEGQRVEVSDKLGELGNSGFSSGPHVHLHFMNGPDILSTSPLPIELDLEGGTYAPQAGEITSS